MGMNPETHQFEHLGSDTAVAEAIGRGWKVFKIGETLTLKDTKFTVQDISPRKLVLRPYGLGLTETEEAAPQTRERSFADINLAAASAHEANRLLCLAQGDESQPKWEDAPQWQRDSAVLGVMFCINNPAATPEDSHNSWLKQKEADGWKYGPTKNAEAKEHPCFVPYEQLPVSQRVKDEMFQLIVRTHLGLG